MSAYYLIAISVIAWGVGSLFYSIANNNIHPIMVTSIVTIVYIIALPLPFIFMKFNHSINANGLIFSILGGVTMAIGSLTYFYALREGGAGIVTTLTSLYPALTLVLSYFFLKETISFKQGLGIALALVSFYLISGKK